MAIDQIKLAKEILDTTAKEIGKKMSQDGIKTFDKKLGENIGEALKEKFSETPKQPTENISPLDEKNKVEDQNNDLKEAQNSLNEIENKIDIEPEKIKENPEPVVKDLSIISEMLNKFKDEIEFARELIGEVKQLQNDVKELIGEDNYNLLAKAAIENLLSGSGGGEIEDETDESE